MVKECSKPFNVKWYKTSHVSPERVLFADVGGRQNKTSAKDLDMWPRKGTGHCYLKIDSRPSKHNNVVTTSLQRRDVAATL